MWPAAAGHTHSGGRERLIFGVLRVFRVKSTGQRARERERARRRMDFRSLFLRILGWGLEHAAESQPNSFPNFYGDRPVPIGHMWSDDRSLLEYADSRASKPVRGWLTANLQKKKYFCFSNRLFLQSRSPRVGRVGRSVFRTTVFGIRVFLV